MSGLYSPFEEKFRIVATADGLQPVFSLLVPVFTFDSAGQEGRRRFFEWEVTTAFLYPEECFGKVSILKYDSDYNGKGLARLCLTIFVEPMVQQNVASSVSVEKKSNLSFIEK